MLYIKIRVQSVKFALKTSYSLNCSAVPVQGKEKKTKTNCVWFHFLLCAGIHSHEVSCQHPTTGPCFLPPSRCNPPGKGSLPVPHSTAESTAETAGCQGPSGHGVWEGWDLRRPGWVAQREALSSVQHMLLLKEDKDGGQPWWCSPGPTPKALRGWLQGSIPGGKGRKGRGERAPLHCCADAALPTSDFLDGFFGNKSWMVVVVFSRAETGAQPSVLSDQLQPACACTVLTTHLLSKNVS